MSVSTTISVFITSDISRVRGSSEPHYVVQGMADMYEVHLFAPEDPKMTKITWHKMQPSGHLPALLWYNFFLLPAFLLHGFRTRPDIVYTYKGFHLAPWLLSRLLGAAWICDFRTEPTSQDREIHSLTGSITFFHRLYYDFFRIFYRAFLPRASLVFGLSEELLARLKAGFGVPSGRMSLLPVGVDTTRFRPQNFDGSYDGNIDIVYLGSITSYRGLDLCIEALAQINLHNSLTLHMVGSGPARVLSDLRDLAEELGVTESIVWHGYVDHDEVPDILAGMDVGVSPLPNHEAYHVMSPAKVYEYLAMGLPVIASDLPAHRYLIDDGKSGFLFQAGEASELAEQFRRVGKLPPEEWPRISKNARAVALKNSWNERIEKVQDEIENLTGRHLAE